MQLLDTFSLSWIHSRPVAYWLLMSPTCRRTSDLDLHFSVGEIVHQSAVCHVSVKTRAVSIDPDDLMLLLRCCRMEPLPIMQQDWSGKTVRIKNGRRLKAGASSLFKRRYYTLWLNRTCWASESTVNMLKSQLLWCHKSHDGANMVAVVCLHTTHIYWSVPTVSTAEQ